MATTEVIPGMKAGPSEHPRIRRLGSGENPQGLARDGYNRSAETYLTWTQSLTNLRPLWLDKLFKHVSESGAIELSSSRCLDVGCGPGVTGTLKIGQTCGHVVGVDISAQQIELARSSFIGHGLPPEKFELLEADMMDLDFPLNKFDIICALYSIVHLPLPQQKVMLSRVYEWLSPRGYLLFNTAAEASSSEGEVIEGWLNMTAYWASFGGSEILAVLHQIGFEVVDSEAVSTSGDSSFMWVIARKPA